MTNKRWLGGAKETSLYGNIRVLSPDGALMFYCNEKRANWYLSRGLAVQESDTVIKLTFTPKGGGAATDEYGINGKENICVVCGTGEDLTKHHVVPYCYRRHFPKELKSRSAHDVVLMCVPHHELYENRYASRLKRKINAEATQDMLPVSIDMLTSIVMKYQRMQNAMTKHSDKIPAERVAEIIQRCKTISEESGMTHDEIMSFEGGKVRDESSKILVENLVDPYTFVKMWRTHFMETMSPAYMPKGWSVNRGLPGS